MLKPRNRKELFLDAIAEGKKATLKPLTREEKFLAKQAERESKSQSTGGTQIFWFDRAGYWDSSRHTDKEYQTMVTKEELLEICQLWGKGMAKIRFQTAGGLAGGGANVYAEVVSLVFNADDSSGNTVTVTFRVGETTDDGNLVSKKLNGNPVITYANIWK